MKPNMLTSALALSFIILGIFSLISIIIFDFHSWYAIEIIGTSIIAIFIGARYFYKLGD